MSAARDVTETDVGTVALLGGKVVTLDAGDRIAEAVLLRGDRILAIGSTAEIRQQLQPDTRQIDLAGHTVVPGLIDGHAHLDREGLKTTLPSLGGARSIAELLDRIAEIAAVTPRGEWIVTNPIGDLPDYRGVPGNLLEGRFPTRHELDRVTPHHPLYIRAPWGYWAKEPPLVSIANSLALERAGIGRSTEPPSPLIAIDRDDAGLPTGVFREAAMAPLVEFTLMAVAPNFDHAQRCDALARSMAIYAGFGTTGVFEGHGVAPEVIAAYQDMYGQGRLALRGHLLFSPGWGDADGEAATALLRSWGGWLGRRGLGDAWLRVAGLYAEIDDSAESRLCARRAPQTGWAGFCADCGLPRAALIELLCEAARNDIRVGAIWADVLALFPEVDRIVPLAGRRWVIGHQAVLTPEQIRSIADLGIVVTTHTSRHVYKEGAKLQAQLGAAAETSLVPLRSLLDAGVCVALGTDNHPPSLFPSIWHAVARQDATGTSIAPSQQLSRMEALRCASTSGATLCFDEAERGTIEPGKLADLAVLSADPLTVPPDRLAETVSELTLTGGRIVHASAGFAQSPFPNTVTAGRPSLPANRS